MTQDQFIKALLSAAKEAGIDEAEVYLATEDVMQIFPSKGKIEQYAVSTVGGASLRGLVRGKMGAAYTEAVDETAIPMLVSNVLQSAALIEDEDEQFIFRGSEAYAAVDCTGDLGTPEKRIAFALEMEEKCLAIDPRVKEVGGFSFFDSTHASVRIANTHGLDLSHEQDGCIAAIDTVAREGDRVVTAFAYEKGASLSELSASRLAENAVAEAVSMLRASPIPSGEMRVILRNTAMSDLLEVYAGVFSADAAQKGLSLLAGKEGEMIAAPCVTLMDDPHMKGGAASRPFDGEGVATRVKQVIEGGRLTTLLHNLKTAKKAGVQTTGNAARGLKSSITVAPSNFYIKPGEKSLSGLEAEMENGLVVTKLEGLHSGANEISGDFSLLCTGHLVRDGKRVQAVEQVTVAGNFFALLKDIVAVGSDLRFGMGSVGSPSVRVSSLSIAGAEE